LKKIVWWIRELLFPRRCPVCDRPVKPAGKKICDVCREKLRYVSGAYCMKCGKPLSGETAEYCMECRQKKHEFVQGMSLYEYESAAASIYRFKYAKRREYAEFFGEELSERFGEMIRKWNVDALIPVPIHKTRKRERGYNQAELLAQQLGRRTGLPVVSDLLVRCRKTTPQKELNALQRQNNLKKAFKISQNDVKLSTIIVIDDIYTTGSTVDEMTKILKQAGVGKVYVLTLAIGSM